MKSSKLIIATLLLAATSGSAMADAAWAAKCGKETVLWQAIGDRNFITVNDHDFPISGGTRRYAAKNGDIITAQFAGTDVNHQVAVVFTDDEINTGKFNLVGWGDNLIPCKVTKFNTW